jgi:hypothetical protein
VWANQTITVRRTHYAANTSRLSYDGAYGKNIIDRYRWEGGCIAEHVGTLPLLRAGFFRNDGCRGFLADTATYGQKWDRGEVWPEEGDKGSGAGD